MTTIKRLLDIAKSQVGYIEGSNNFSKYGKWYGVNGYANAAWCATFVSWCFDKAGMPLPPIQHSKGFAYCPFGVSYFRKIGRLYKYPKVGDIVFFDWQRDGTSDHVGLVLEVRSNATIKTIEGNTSPKDNSNGGMVMVRTRKLRHCLGFARVKPGENSHQQGNRVLRVETPMMNGADVRQLQEKLRSLRYKIAVDGWYGKETERAVEAFQLDNGLTVDGIVGSQTWGSIQK